MQRGEAVVVWLVHIRTVVDQLVYHGILAVVAGDVKCCVSIDIDLINLQRVQHRVSKITGANLLHFPQKA